MIDRGTIWVLILLSLATDGGRGSAIGIAARAARAFLATGACGLLGRVGCPTVGSAIGYSARGSGSMDGSIGDSSSVDSVLAADSDGAG